jgi:hypothetical protein
MNVSTSSVYTCPSLAPHVRLLTLSRQQRPRPVAGPEPVTRGALSRVRCREKASRPRRPVITPKKGNPTLTPRRVESHYQEPSVLRILRQNQLRSRWTTNTGGIPRATKAALLERIQASDRVYYVQQLEVLHEATFFHWITGRALRELIDEGRVNAVWDELLPKVRIRLIMRKSYRHWKREGQRVLALVRQFSAGDFGRAIGPYGEMLVDAALGGIGVRLLGRDVRDLYGRTWTRTEHNLDRAYELEGVRYGVEIKNTLKYIDDNELSIKLQICEMLGLRPLFVVRMMPKSWAWPRVIKGGGYVMMLGEQFYPVGYEGFAAEVREQLLLPVSCPRRLADGPIDKFRRWHDANLDRNRLGYGEAR